MAQKIPQGMSLIAENTMFTNARVPPPEAVNNP